MMKDTIIKKEKGAIIAMFILLLPFMMAFVGLAIDFGYIYATKTKMQNTADAAALAGVVHIHADNVGRYVTRMLDGNDFKSVGDGSDKELTSSHNWKLNYQKVTKDSAGNDQIIELTDDKEATRLRVTIMKTIDLMFVPIAVPSLRSIDLTATAVAQGTAEKPPVVDFQVMTLKTLILGKFKEGTVEKNDVGDVHIPSYPGDPELPPGDYRQPPKKAQDLYGYNDWGESLPRHIFAKDIELKTESTLRLSGKLVTNTVSNHYYDTQLFLADYNDHLSWDTNKEEFKKSTISNRMSAEFATGISVARDAIKLAAEITEKEKEYEEAKKAAEKDPTLPMPEEPDLAPKPIILDLNSEKSTYPIGDYTILDLFKKSTYKKSFNGLDIVVPVIIKNSKNKPFTAQLNVSFFSFAKSLVIINGNLEISGSSYPNKASSNFPELKIERDYTTYNSVYCYSINVEGSGDKSFPGGKSDFAGNILVASGAAAEKSFDSVIYADSGIWISSAKNYRRHRFRNTLMSPEDIVFAADNASIVIKPATNMFDSVAVETKISLVE